MKLDKKEVEKISHLARIDLTEEEKEKFQKELSSILEYVEKLNEVNTDKVDPTHQVTGLKNVWRDDEIYACDAKQREEIITNFPNKEDGLLKVPAVFSPKDKK